MSEPARSVVEEFTPIGAMRASLNLGNPVLARSRTSLEKPAGVSIDLAREFARELAVDVSFIEFDTAAKSVDALTNQQADIGFMAIDPLRAAGVHFTPAYVQIEGCYLVTDDSPILGNGDVDRPGVRIVVGAGSAYELYLSRTLKHAELLKVPTSEAVVGAMLEKSAQVAAGVRQQLQADAQRVAGLRLLDGRFMVINQAMAMPKGRSPAAKTLLDDFVARMKATGFVADALARHGIDGAAVAP
ncbi:MAG: transporter substrate-binding domain-containing protein [Pseudomonadota bacterium]|nr:transporter substrate-binding domain-containing protein [Pseudomonadota bacterium]